MDQFADWDRFMEILEESRTPDRAMKRYKKEKEMTELNAYKRDVRRDRAEEKKPASKG